MMTVTPWKLLSWDIKLLDELHVATLRRRQTAGHIMMSHDVTLSDLCRITGKIGSKLLSDCRNVTAQLMMNQEVLREHKMNE